MRGTTCQRLPGLKPADAIWVVGWDLLMPSLSLSLGSFEYSSSGSKLYSAVSLRIAKVEPPPAPPKIDCKKRGGQ